ncbi:HU family DNA-binding protein [Chitinophagaceae bacterium MMS25-I14]
MSVKFNAVERINPRQPANPKKWYAIARSAGELTLRELANEISERCTLTNADIYAVLESLLQVIPQEIAKGNIVRLGDFGSFSLTLNSSGVATQEEVTSSVIKGNRLHFRPGKAVADQLNAITYRKL